MLSFLRKKTMNDKGLAESQITLKSTVVFL